MVRKCIVVNTVYDKNNFIEWPQENAIIILYIWFFTVTMVYTLFLTVGICKFTEFRKYMIFVWFK